LTPAASEIPAESGKSGLYLLHGAEPPLVAPPPRHNRATLILGAVAGGLLISLTFIGGMATMWLMMPMPIPQAPEPPRVVAKEVPPAATGEVSAAQAAPSPTVLPQAQERLNANLLATSAIHLPEPLPAPAVSHVKPAARHFLRHHENASVKPAQPVDTGCPPSVCLPWNQK
jgi:hypothetical protein